MQRRLDETSSQFDFTKDSSLETQAYKGQLFWSIVLFMVVFAIQGLMISAFKMAEWDIPGSICFPQLQVLNYYVVKIFCVSSKLTTGFKYDRRS